MATNKQMRMKMKDYLLVRKQRERSATSGSVNWTPAATVIPSSLTPQHPYLTSVPTYSHKHWALLGMVEPRRTVLKATIQKWSDARPHNSINPRRTSKMTTSENLWQPDSSLNHIWHSNKRHKPWWSVMRKSKMKRRTMTRQIRRISAMVTLWRRRNWVILAPLILMIHKFARLKSTQAL